MCACSFASVMSDSSTPWTIACQAPLSMEFYRQIPWRRAWQHIPVFLPGESHGQRSLVDYSPWGHRVRHEWRDLACTLWPITCSCLFSVLEAMKWGLLDPIWLRIVSIWVFLSVNTSSPLFWGVRKTLSPDLHFRVLKKYFLMSIQNNRKLL